MVGRIAMAQEVLVVVCQELKLLMVATVVEIQEHK